MQRLMAAFSLAEKQKEKLSTPRDQERDKECLVVRPPDCAPFTQSSTAAKDDSFIRPGTTVSKQTQPWKSTHSIKHNYNSLHCVLFQFRDTLHSVLQAANLCTLHWGLTVQSLLQCDWPFRLPTITTNDWGGKMIMTMPRYCVQARARFRVLAGFQVQPGFQWMRVNSRRKWPHLNQDKLQLHWLVQFYCIIITICIWRARRIHLLVCLCMIDLWPFSRRSFIDLEPNDPLKVCFHSSANHWILIFRIYDNLKEWRWPFFDHDVPRLPQTAVAVCQFRCIQTCPRLHLNWLWGKDWIPAIFLHSGKDGLPWRDKINRRCRTWTGRQKSNLWNLCVHMR